MPLDKLESVIALDVAPGVEFPDDLWDAIETKVKYLDWNWALLVENKESEDRFVMPQLSCGAVFFVDIHRNDNADYTITGATEVPNWSGQVN